MNPTDFDIGVLREIPSQSHAILWLFAASGILSIILARVISNTYIAGLFKYSKNYNQQLFSLNTLSAPLLLFNYIIAITLCLSIMAGVLSDGESKPNLFTIFLGVSAFYALKTSAQYLLANWFQRKDLFDIKNAFRLYQIIGLVILPITIFAIYQSEQTKLYFSVLMTIIIVISLVVYWYFSMKDSIQYKISYLYIFLYLCTLEILPLLLMGKYLLS